MTFNPIPFDVLAGLVNWAKVVGCVFAAVFVIAFLLQIASRGAQGPAFFFRQLVASVMDWLTMSPRRIWALTLLTFREASRRKVFTIGVIFIVLIMFAGWFLGDSTERPEMQVKRYVSFMLTTIGWLILPVVVILSCWGIPEDIKARSLHTVVTKPVKRNEVVLGRIFGFNLIGTVALLTMGVAGYAWMMRSLNEETRGSLTARVPVYGEISWLNKQGNEALQGDNVGDIWTFRSYIAGNTKARAIWDFTGIDEDSFRKNPQTGEPELHLESTFNVFRSFKGDLERGILARYTFVNDSRGLRVSVDPFEVQEFRAGANVMTIPRKITYGPDRSLSADILDDLADDGNLRIEVECLTTSQYLGAAQSDLFIRLPEQSFASSFGKAIFGIWMMMTTAIVLSVCLSCVVKGPVAMLAAGCIIVIGKSFWGFLAKVASGDVEGGGVIEGIIRIHRHITPNVEFQEDSRRQLVESIDKVPQLYVQVSRYLIPDLSQFNMTEYVANGFDIPFSAGLLPALATMLGFCIPWIFLGYLALKFRELESK